MNTHHAAVDLQKYYQRIGYAAAPSADLATLHAIHLAHATHVPFENIDVLLSRPIRLDSAESGRQADRPATGRLLL